MFSEGVDPSQQHLLSYPLALQTADADEAASLLAESAVPYRAELLSPSGTFSTEIFVAAEPANAVVTRQDNWSPESARPVARRCLRRGSRDRRRGGAQRRRANSSRCARDRAWWNRHCSPSKPALPERFELLFLRLSRENLVQELEKMLVRGINTPLVFSPCFQLRTEAGQRFRRLLLSLCGQLGQKVRTGS